MRTVAECKERAEGCRRLAILGADRRDWGHFEEMAQTWDMLARQKQEKLRSKTAAAPFGSVTTYPDFSVPAAIAPGASR
jgi:hypothetical protein